jgi:hypothetical protein
MAPRNSRSRRGRSLRLHLGLALLGAGVLVGLVGSFWLLYGGDEGSDNVTIRIGDDDYNAQTIGAVALMIGVASVWISLRLLRTRRRADRDADPI